MMRNYEINVYLNGRHFFATHERSLRTFVEMVTVFGALRRAFKPESGFEIEVTQVETNMTTIEVPFKYPVVGSVATECLGDKWLQTK